MLTEQKITWSNAHYKWNDFKLGNEYQQYLLDAYGITVESGGRVIWKLGFKIAEVQISFGAAGPEHTSGGIKKKLEKKKIKLIFIMGDVRNEISKDIKTIVPIKAVSDIQNKIEEITKTKISLSDVQIIKG
jgi:hypothetical protein